jgi:lysophospholipase L1-like esterase
VLGAFLIAVLGLPFSASAEEKYYLSLGDSLAVGFQPPPVSWNHGYADQLQAMIPDLTLKKLGCYTDESTSAMINGGSCSYPHGTQLAEAVAFLQAHKNSVALITIDIGANDVLNCFAVPIDMSCLANGLTVIKQNLPTILTALRAAAGKDVPIVGMNYYDPYLVHWLLQGKGGVVTDSLKATLMFNDTLEMIYKAALPVPDVEGALSTTNFTPKVQTDFGTIPLKTSHRSASGPGCVRYQGFTLIPIRTQRGPVKLLGRFIRCFPIRDFLPQCYHG